MSEDGGRGIGVCIIMVALWFALALTLSMPDIRREMKDRKEENINGKQPLRGAMLPIEWIEAFGLPEHTIGFTMHAEDPSEPVIVEAKYFPYWSDGDLETIATVFLQYEPVEVDE